MTRIVIESFVITILDPCVEVSLFQYHQLKMSTDRITESSVRCRCIDMLPVYEYSTTEYISITYSKLGTSFYLRHGEL